MLPGRVSDDDLVALDRAGGVVDPVRRLATAAGRRTVVTRWVPATDPQGSWAAYLDAWPFARVPADDPLYELVDEVRDIEAPVVTATTFGKWVPDLVAIMGSMFFVVGDVDK